MESRPYAIFKPYSPIANPLLLPHCWIYTANGNRYPGLRTKRLTDFTHMMKGVSIVGIDEGQWVSHRHCRGGCFFFQKKKSSVRLKKSYLLQYSDLIPFITTLVKDGTDVVISMLTGTFRQTSFPVFGEVCALADVVIMKTAVCSTCHNRPASFTVRTKQVPRNMTIQVRMQKGRGRKKTGGCSDINVSLSSVSLFSPYSGPTPSRKSA